MKSLVFFIAQSEPTCDFIANQLMGFLGEYIDVKTWCLERSLDEPENFNDANIYIFSNRTVLKSVYSRIAEDKTVLLAARTINIDTLDKILQIEHGSNVIVVGTTKETALMSISMIENLGITHLNLIPYCPQTTINNLEEIKIAITTGHPNLIPSHIETIVDLGAKGLDLSTYAELIRRLNIPMTVLNEISHYFIKTILDITVKSEEVTEKNIFLKKNIDVILDTVDEAIVAVNNFNEVILFNPAAERLLEVNSDKIIGKNLRDIFPQINFTENLKTGKRIINDFLTINDNHYIVNANPLIIQAGIISGLVLTFRLTGDVQKLEIKVRQKLKKKGHVAKHSFNNIVGKSELLQKTLELAENFAKSDLTILLEGESGTGKELFAQSIHNSSTRKNGPFVAINFAALPENLVESELFGYDDGAFTGAKKGGQIGLFEEAHTGTIFLDEIGDAPLDVQKKLLRVLEEREVRKVGGSTVTPIDVRIVAATNKNLEELTKKDLFRSDLFYRLCAVPITVPPLREREGDILLLVDYFAQTLYRRKVNFDTALKKFLIDYHWPGNIRELQNVVQYMCNVDTNSHLLSLRHLPSYMLRHTNEIYIGKSNNELLKTDRDIFVAELEGNGLLRSIVFILEEIGKASMFGRGLGRNSLQKKLLENSIHLSDYQIKYWLKTLNTVGYITSGTTRQGSKLTDSGKSFLEYIKNINLKDNFK